MRCYLECSDRWLNIVIITLKETLIFSLWNQTKKQIIFHGLEQANKDLTPLYISWHSEQTDTDKLNRQNYFLDDFDSPCYCFCICPEVWSTIFKFLHVRDLANFWLVNRKFCYITSLHKTVKKFSNFYKKFFKIEILTKVKSFLKNLNDELKLHFNFSDLIYFNYCLSFLDSFDLDQFLLHLFFCPRVELVFNECYFCSVILTENTE